MKKMINSFIDRFVQRKVLVPMLSLESGLKWRGVQETVDYIEENLGGIPLRDTRKRLLGDIKETISKKPIILEFGVYKGQSTRELARLWPEATIHAFDSFEGLPEDWDAFRKKGMFTLKGAVPDLPPQATPHKGWFNESLPAFLKDNPSIQPDLIHIDCDIYSSTKTIFDELEKHIRPGTYILFDEYFGYFRWRDHEYKAFQEFIEKMGKQYSYIGYTAKGKVLIRIK